MPRRPTQEWIDAILWFGRWVLLLAVGAVCGASAALFLGQLGGGAAFVAAIACLGWPTLRPLGIGLLIGLLPVVLYFLAASSLDDGDFNMF